MSSLETGLGRNCSESKKIARKLEEDFRDNGARVHLVECVLCRNSLEGVKGSVERISTLVRNIRDGIACAG